MITIFLINILSKQCSSSKHGITHDTHVGSVEQAELQSSYNQTYIRHEKTKRSSDAVQVHPWMEKVTGFSVLTP